MKVSAYREIKRVMHEYKRTGSKENRSRQAKRIELGVQDIFDNEPKVNTIEGVGRKQIIRFWWRHENLAQKTRVAYWYAFKVLFEKLGNNQPPKPREDKVKIKVKIENNKFEFVPIVKIE